MNKISKWWIASGAALIVVAGLGVGAVMAQEDTPTATTTPDASPTAESGTPQSQETPDAAATPDSSTPDNGTPDDGPTATWRAPRRLRREGRLGGRVGGVPRHQRR